jgi:hypothetical protein
VPMGPLPHKSTHQPQAEGRLVSLRDYFGYSRQLQMPKMPFRKTPVMWPCYAWHCYAPHHAHEPHLLHSPHHSHSCAWNQYLRSSMDKGSTWKGGQHDKPRVCSPLQFENRSWINLHGQIVGKIWSSPKKPSIKRPPKKNMSKCPNRNTYSARQS